MQELRKIFAAIEVIDQHARAIAALADEQQRAHEYECMMQDLHDLQRHVVDQMRLIATAN